jgi:prepilin-type N-terminal cleavage/methylation domain-containing protein
MTNTGTDRGYSLLEVVLVAGLIGVLSAIAIPMTANSLKTFRISGDARGISGMTALAKLRAASALSRTRVYIDQDAGSYRLERKNAASGWITEGGTTYLSTGVTLWHDDDLSTAPPDTQGPAVAQASKCLDASDTPIEKTACLMFNSRGIPIDSTGTPTGVAAVYVIDGMVVYRITVSATGLTQVWQTPSPDATWVKQ